MQMRPQRIDCEGRWITPGLIDCHTHLVYGGNRAHEFELRLQGASYEEIARAGGGIVSTVAATRAASEAELVASALPRLDALIAEGVTTLEIKSGYGLNTETEMRQLSAARTLGQQPAGRDPHHLPRRACAAAGSRGRQGPLHRPRLRRDAAGGGARPGLPMPSTPSWKASPSPASRPRGFPGGKGARACRSSCTPTSSPISAALRSPRNSPRCRPIISSTPMRPALPRWRGRDGRRAVAGGVLFHPRDQQASGRAVPQSTA